MIERILPAAPARSVAAAILFLLGAGAAAGQDARPAGWKWQTEPGAADTAWRFDRMPPGWHITTGPAVLAWDETAAFEGRYAVESEMILFPESQNEGYGLFVAGRGLEGADAHYVAFLVRQDGAAGVFRVQAGRSEPLRDWAAAAPVRALTGSETVSNTLRVEVEGAETVFRVNGEEVARVPGAAVGGSGHVGFRIMGGVNLHITTLDVLQRLAPPRGS
jgi:hypothetical protein